jgi:hypothetical protein
MKDNLAAWGVLDVLPKTIYLQNMLQIPVPIPDFTKILGYPRVERSNFINCHDK